MSARHRLTAAVIAEDAEIIAIIDFNLRMPGGATYDPAAYCRHGIHPVSNTPVGLKSRLLDESPGSADVGEQEKEGFVAVFDVGNAVSTRIKLVEGNARKYGKGQGFPFIAGRPPGQAKGGKAIEILTYSSIQ